MHFAHFFRGGPVRFVTMQIEIVLAGRDAEDDHIHLLIISRRMLEYNTHTHTHTLVDYSIIMCFERNLPQMVQ